MSMNDNKDKKGKRDKRMGNKYKKDNGRVKVRGYGGEDREWKNGGK